MFITCSSSTITAIRASSPANRQKNLCQGRFELEQQGRLILPFPNAMTQQGVFSALWLLGSVEVGLEMEVAGVLCAQSERLILCNHNQ